jgi:hypothetical protein
LSSGSLFNGLALDSDTGKLTGTPTTAGSVGVTVQLSDSLGAQVARDFTIIVE